MFLKNKWTVPIWVLLVSYLFACSGPSEINSGAFAADETQILTISITPDTLNLLGDGDFSDVGFSLLADFNRTDRLAFPLFAQVFDLSTNQNLSLFEIDANRLNDKQVRFNGIVRIPNASFIDLNIQLNAPLQNGDQLRAEKRIIALGGENFPPEILEISYPDTAIVPNSGQNVIGFLARATDPQGLSDIPAVYVDIFTESSMNQDGQLTLLDNGSDENGDAEAGDGVFTAVVGLTPSSTPRTFLLRWYALDRQGLSSDTLETRFTTIPE